MLAFPCLENMVFDGNKGFECYMIMVGGQKLLWGICITEFTLLSECFMRKVKKDCHLNEINKNFTNRDRVDE